MNALVIASDHAGHQLKSNLVAWLGEKGAPAVKDIGPFSADPIDYPDSAAALCRAVLSDDAGRGILICGSGIGMSIAANRFRGIRAALCLYPGMAFYARRHNDANVLVLAGNFTASFLAREITEIFLAEKYDGGRHTRRIDKLDAI